MESCENYQTWYPLLRFAEIVTLSTPRLLPRGAGEPDMLRVSPSDLLDAELGRGHDRADALKFGLGLTPSQIELAGALHRLRPDAGVAFESKACGLQDCGNRRTNDVFTVRGEIGMAASRKRAATTAVVAVEGDVEHGDFWAPRGLGQRDFRDFDFRVRLPVPVQLAHALLRFVAEDENFFGLGLPQHGAGNGCTVKRRRTDANGVVAACKHNPVERNVRSDLPGDQI